MNWLEFNHVHINYFDKKMSFPKLDASDELFVSAKKMDEFVKDYATMFIILASMKAESKVVIGEFPVVYDFPKVFPDDINDLLLKPGVEFAIDLVPCMNSMSMPPYKIPASELGELKKQLEDLLEKNFVRSSVS